MSTTSQPRPPRSVTGLAAIGTAAFANLCGGCVASALLAKDDVEGFFGSRFFLGPPVLLLLAGLVLSVVGIVLIVRRGRESPGVAIRRGRFVALVFVWLLLLSALVVAAVIEFDPWGHWKLSLAALSLPFLGISIIVAIPLSQIVPRLLRGAGCVVSGR